MARWRDHMEGRGGTFLPGVQMTRLGHRSLCSERGSSVLHEVAHSSVDVWRDVHPRPVKPVAILVSVIGNEAIGSESTTPGEPVTVWPGPPIDD